MTPPAITAITVSSLEVNPLDFLQGPRARHLGALSLAALAQAVALVVVLEGRMCRSRSGVARVHIEGPEEGR